MSFKAVILLSRREDMTPAEFTSWWLNEHAPLAAQLPGARRVVFNTVDDTTDIDGISELWFDTQADFEAAYATELGKVVAADSMAHVRSRTRLFVEENVVVAGAE
ncbi:MAG: EthD domain-containing protein [Ilumatobacteraceae bacterium]